MIYMGSKAKIADYIVPIIQSHIAVSKSKTYIEPFCGGCNIIDKVKAQNRIAADKNQYLIALFKHLQDGGSLPDEITKEEYDRVKKEKGRYPQWYVGAVGFLASYNGRFFDGGYAGERYSDGRIRRYYEESKRNLMGQIHDGGIVGIDFIAKDYREFRPSGCVVYCDPPYGGTKGYETSKDFEPPEFWKTMREWSKDNVVLISELSAPEDFIAVWKKSTDRSIKAREHIKATEKLFIYGG